eukprot:1840109-Rhodomonas_salina.1
MVNPDVVWIGGGGKGISTFGSVTGTLEHLLASLDPSWSSIADVDIRAPEPAARLGAEITVQHRLGVIWRRYPGSGIIGHVAGGSGHATG